MHPSPKWLLVDVGFALTVLTAECVYCCHSDSDLRLGLHALHCWVAERRCISVYHCHCASFDRWLRGSVLCANWVWLLNDKLRGFLMSLSHITRKETHTIIIMNVNNKIGLLLLLTGSLLFLYYVSIWRFWVQFLHHICVTSSLIVLAIHLPSPVEDFGHAYWVQRQVRQPMISLGENEMVGQANLRPATATDIWFFFFFLPEHLIYWLLLGC